MRRIMLQPTESELEILQVLWESGPATVKSVNDALNLRREVGYTTTLKIMQIMLEKNMLKRSKQGRSHVYRAVYKAGETRRMLLENLRESAFSGSMMQMVLQALGSYTPSREEIDRIRELLEEKERETQ